MPNAPIHTIVLTHEQATTLIDATLTAWKHTPPSAYREALYTLHTYLDTLIPICTDDQTPTDTPRPDSPR